MKRRAKFVPLSTMLLLAGCASSTKPGDMKLMDGFGETKAAAIEVCMPQGQRAYLARLVCADGSRPWFVRAGSFGSRVEPPLNMSQEQVASVMQSMATGRALKPGEIDHHIIDGYEVVCGSAKRTIFMDMYHCQSALPDRAPAGFVLQGKN